MEATRNNQVNVLMPDGISRQVPCGTSLSILAGEYQHKYDTRIIGARVNNDIRELNFILYEDCKVDFVDLLQDDGMRIYKRSLYFILIKAVRDLYPDRKVVINHSISKGLYCEIQGTSQLTENEVVQIKKRMGELVEARVPFIKREVTVQEAKAVFEASGRLDRYHAIEHRDRAHVTIYRCDGLDDYFYGYMAPDTGYIRCFDLKFYSPGFILLFPEMGKPDVLPEFIEQKKLFQAFDEYKRWGRILGVDNVGALNDLINAGEACDIIRVSEALHEKKIAQIADMIAFNPEKKRLVLISGPSSSGKTTFAHRLSIQLRVNGLKPVTISLDDYFVDREHTPVDEKGEADFEALEAIDVQLFNYHLAELIRGNEVEVPIYNFTQGRREPAGRKLSISEDQILVIEGIHGLNEKLTATIQRASKFKIYVSALTSINIDDHNRIPSTDTRKIRRIVRDHQFRGSTALSTMKRWASVRRGEDRNIFPFQEEADVMFNSALVYELSVLKANAEPLLNEIDSSQPEYSEARRLIEFLSYFLPMDPKEIPLNSIIREFIGGSFFY